MGEVYKGDQPFEDFLRLEAQGLLFERPVTERHAVVTRLTVTAMHVLEDLGRDAPIADLSDEIKQRAASKRIVYDVNTINTALLTALRERRR